MNRGEFVKTVQALTGLPDKAMAEEGIQIVFSLFSHRLTPEEAKDVASQLSQDMKSLWYSDTWINHFLSISRQFQLRYRKKAELYSLVENEISKRQLPVGAEQLTQAVFHVLKEQIAPGEADDIASQLPAEIESVWKAA